MPQPELTYRLNLAAQAFESYDFGETVELLGQESWNTENPEDLTKIVYVAVKEPDMKADSFAVSFHAKFCADSGNLIEAYALETNNGPTLGRRLDFSQNTNDQERDKGHAAMNAEFEKAFQQALTETMPPMDEAGKLRWWFTKGMVAERTACAKLCFSVGDCDGIDMDGVMSADECGRRILKRTEKNRTASSP
jgi:hypothetical protein